MSGRGKTDEPIHYKTSTGGEFWFPSPYGSQHQITPTEPPRLYKAVRPDGTAPIAWGGSGRYKWSLPTKNPDGTWTPGEWMEPEDGFGPLQFCRRGLHAFDGEHWSVWIDYGPVFVIEFDGPVAFEVDKWLGARARLLREVPLQAAVDAIGGNKLLKAKVSYTDALSRPRTIDDRKAEWLANYTAEIESKAHQEFRDRFIVQTIEANTEVFGDLLEMARKAAADDDWYGFQAIVSERRRAAVSLLRAEQRVSRVINGDKPGKARPATKRLANFYTKMFVAMERTRMGWSRPWRDPSSWSWSGNLSRREAIRLVGAEWYDDYVKRTTEALDGANAEAEAQWATMPDDLTFDKLVDMLEADPNALTALASAEAPKKRRGRR